MAENKIDQNIFFFQCSVQLITWNITLINGVLVSTNPIRKNFDKQYEFGNYQILDSIYQSHNFNWANKHPTGDFLMSVSHFSCKRGQKWFIFLIEYNSKYVGDDN